MLRSYGRFGPYLTLLALGWVVLGCGSDHGGEGFEPLGNVPDGGAQDATEDKGLVLPDSGMDQGPLSDAQPENPPYPILLHHGFSGWKEIDLLGLNYFYGIVEDLQAHGETDVHVTAVEPYASSEYRASQLGDAVDEIVAKTGKGKVNIIAHSQGGLDARYLISSLGYGDRIASLTTISTPHRGTRVADAILKLVPDWSNELLSAIADIIGRELFDIDTDANLRASLEGLSERYVRRTFNPQNLDDPRVSYFSYAGRSNDSNGIPDCNGSWVPDDPTKIDRIDPLLMITGEYLKKPGDGVSCVNDNCSNDGMVTVQSSRWGLFMGCFPADHFDEVGQIMMNQPNAESGYDHRAFYRLVVERLRGFGK